MLTTSLCVLLYLSVAGSAPVHIATNSDEHSVSVHVDGHNSLYVGPSVAGGPMQINLSKADLSLSTITIGRARHTSTTNNCYYNGIVLQEHSQTGWANVFMCNKSLHGILTINEEMYRLHQTTPETYELNLISSGNAKDSIIRSKRHEHLITERTIEVSIVVDEVMSNYHKDNHLELYLFDIMNTVAHLFRHPTTESIIKIAVVNITVLKENDLKLSGNENGELLKHKFCQWKRDQEMTSDISILMTRRSICESTDSCGILGITTLNSMCDQSKSCAIVKDTGFSSAFTISHEIGHSLGIHHDGDKNADCDSGNYIMSSSFEGSINPHQWSRCSKQQLDEFLSSSQSSCLKNNPSTEESLIESVVPLPGRNYTLNQQCELLFGSNAVSCEKTNCSTLWCSNDTSVTCTETQYSPPAAGSPCGSSDGICYHGECIDSSLVTNTVHGSWGEWSGWSHCTVSCGMGIQHSDRQCDSPAPQFSGRYCAGSRRRYRVCHKQKCQSDMNNYRDMKCRELGPSSNQQGATSTAEHWISVDEKRVANFDHLNPCKLYCQREGQSDFTVLEDVVSNGVSCHSHHFERGVCIDGSCIKVGCDDHLNTPSYTDMCGVMCGDNSTCQLVEGTFIADKLSTTLDAVTIPSGSKHIAIDDVSAHSTDNYIIAEDVLTKQVFDQSLGIRYSLFSGTLFYFSSNGLSLKANGLIKNDIKIKVFVKAGVAKWKYSFMAPANHIHETLEWSEGEWSECTNVCGLGVQTRSVTCRLNGHLVDEEKCSAIAKPTTNKTCELEDCSLYGWKLGQWSKCSSECGKGVKEREVICTHTSTGGVVDEQYCIAVKPDERVTCNETKCPKWEEGNWSQCSVTCGTAGMKSREVQCLNSNGSVSVNCDQSTKPVAQIQCSLPECPSAICEDTFPNCAAVKFYEYCPYFMTDCCETCSS